MSYDKMTHFLRMPYKAITLTSQFAFLKPASIPLFGEKKPFCTEVRSQKRIERDSQKNLKKEEELKEIVARW